ncbi:zeta toxin family protein [Arcicella lustrica]|uniref:Zeta toxin family protein n=1 Tax=Arcicella lustrica TaxID=2984196 RepID=A0ABU5SHR4_9BACT|nr:zeta toxin family protein [Arcicella sp. DC25W]MEA5426830.1 zeta toxin family protein [Arcicella sp. DC25W]
MPNLFVITGANGAGKSTLSKDLLPQEFSLLDVFDGDKFFVEKLKAIFPSQIKSPKYARDLAFQATVEAFESLVENAIKENKNFAYEGHFSTASPWKTIEQFKIAGYRITMFFLMVDNVELSQKRVSERVKTGGHYVTSKEIEKNYYGNLIQLNSHFDLLDELIIADNSQLNSPSLLFHYSNQEQLFKQSLLPNWFETYLTKICFPS